MSTVLKWLGGKSSLMSEINRILPKGRRLIEPFVGSCAVAMNTSYDAYLLADINQDLIDLYSLIRDSPKEVTELARGLFACSNTCDEYYRLRTLFNERTSDKLFQSVLFLYLNRHGYRGMCRYNKSRCEFNVPYGHYKHPYFPEKEIQLLNSKLKKATLHCGSFHETLEQAEEGDIVYCDPPYIKKGRFTEYHSTAFSITQQNELVDSLNRLTARGVSVVVSSHDSEEIRSVFSGFQLTKVTARRSVGVAAGKEKFADELIAFRSADQQKIAV